MKDNKIVLPPDANGGVSITPPQGCEVDKVEVVDGVLTVTFKAAERKLPIIVEEITKLPDEELCLMLEEEAAWMFYLPPHEEPHPAPYVGNELFTLYSEIIKRLRKYSKEKGGKE